MDSEKLWEDMEKQVLWLNQQRKLPFDTPMGGVAYMRAFVENWICVREATEEKEAEEEMRREAMEEANEGFD